MRDIRSQDILFWAGGNVLEKYGTLVRRTSPLAAPALVTTRASAGSFIGRDGVMRQAGAGRPRVEWLDLDGDGHRETPATVLERGTTNKVVRTIGYGSTGTANWTLHASSPAEATLTAVDDAAELARAGLSGIVPDGHVLKLDNSGGATDARVDSTATATGNTAPHTLSAYVRGSGQMRLRLTGAPTPEPAWVDAPTIYTRIVSTQTPNADSSFFSVRARPGAIVYFVLAQMEEGEGVSSVVPNAGTTAITRALDVLTAPCAHGLISFTGYVRFLETGGVQLTSATVASWFGAGDGEIWLRSSSESPTYWITLRDSRGASAQVQTTPGVTTQVGQLVELMPQVEVSSQGVRARLIQAVDGGDPVTSSWTGYVQADWVPTTLRLVSRASGSNQGQLNLRDLVVLRGSDWTMDAARRLVG